jgi:hypothetical protein
MQEPGCLSEKEQADFLAAALTSVSQSRDLQLL